MRGSLHPRPEGLVPRWGNSARHARCDRQAGDRGGGRTHSDAEDWPIPLGRAVIPQSACRCDDKSKPDDDQEPCEVRGRSLQRPKDSCCHSKGTSGKKKARDSPVEEASATSHLSTVRDVASHHDAPGRPVAEAACRQVHECEHVQRRLTARDARIPSGCGHPVLGASFPRQVPRRPRAPRSRSASELGRHSARAMLRRRAQAPSATRPAAIAARTASWGRMSTRLAWCRWIWAKAS